MAYCSKCGAYIADGSNVCPACGKRVGVSSEKTESANGAAAAQAQAADQEKKKTASANAEQKAPGAESTGAKTSEQSTAGESGTYHYSYKKSTDAKSGAGSGSSANKYYNAAGPDFRRYASDKYRDNSTDSTQNFDPFGRNVEDLPVGLSLLSYFGLLFLIPYFARRDSDFARFHANQGLLLFLFNAIISVIGNYSFLIGAAGWIFSAVCFFMGIGNVIHHRMRELPLIGKFRFLK